MLTKMVMIDLPTSLETLVQPAVSRNLQITKKGPMLEQVDNQLGCSNQSRW